ncbi:MAG: prolipoprotein diacylglyceryl transferase [Thermodesulfobacteriota bacterium]
MTDLTFVGVLAVLVGLLFRWGFAVLPQEAWQIMAAVPIEREGSRMWRGCNFTFYGFFLAGASAASAALIIILACSIGVHPLAILLVMALMLGLCVPSTRIIARIVEKKRHTLTIGGASFVGLVVAPWALWAVDEISGGYRVPMAPGLAALSIGYALGEGLGRLGCISFGCCYGRPLPQCSPRIRHIFRRFNFVFLGHTKKVAYEGCLEGAEVVPIQAVTALIYAATGLIGTALFLRGYFSLAFAFTIIATLLWRALSELLRADYRGEGRISAYQVLAVVGILYSLIVTLLLPSESVPSPDLWTGLLSLWDPVIILSLQTLWLCVFLFTGKSTVTECLMTFRVIGSESASKASRDCSAGEA